jgi:histo-blood group ABO system transferase
MKVCIVTIATGRYIQFVEKLLNKVTEHFLTNHDIHCLLFTDNDMDEVSDNIKVSQIEHKPWPEPALKKYNYIYSEREYLKGFDYVYLFDADIDIVDTVDEEVMKDLVGVLHPWKILEDKSVYPYEGRKNSTAYVSDSDRDKYYAAAFTGGKSKNFLKMAEIISARVSEDEGNGIIAVWHDESHLNKYFNENPPVDLPPSYMFPEELMGNDRYPWKPKIVAVNKDAFDTSFNDEKKQMGQYGKIK